MGLCTREILNHLKYQTILLNMQRERLLKLLEQLFFFQTVTSVCIPAVGKEVSSWSQQRKSRCCQEIYWDWRSVWGMAPVSQFKDCDKTDCRGGVLVFHPCEHFCVGVCEEGSIPCSWPRVKMESGNVKVAWEWDCPPMIYVSCNTIGVEWRWKKEDVRCDRTLRVHQDRSHVRWAKRPSSLAEG